MTVSPASIDAGTPHAYYCVPALLILPSAAFPPQFNFHPFPSLGTIKCLPNTPLIRTEGLPPPKNFSSHRQVLQAHPAAKLQAQMLVETRRKEDIEQAKSVRTVDNLLRQA